jgi:hypothetical protein
MHTPTESQLAALAKASRAASAAVSARRAGSPDADRLYQEWKRADAAYRRAYRTN